MLLRRSLAELVILGLRILACGYFGNMLYISEYALGGNVRMGAFWPFGGRSGAS